MVGADMPVGVFDSGLGGMSVLRELVNLMPNEDFIYFGDSANAPYGTKSADTVRALTLKNFEYLYSLGIKAFVIACNTATSVAVATLRERYKDVEIIGVEPALKPAALCAPHPTVAVLATPLTLRETKFAELLSRYSDHARVIPFACPGLVEYVEGGILSGDELRSFLSELLAPLKREKLDCVVLGCTHYPLIKQEIIRVLGEDIRVFDGGSGTARQTLHRLADRGWLRPETRIGKVDFIDSMYPDEINSVRSSYSRFWRENLCN